MPVFNLHRCIQYILILAVSTSFTGCFKASKIVEIELNATTDEGVPIENAEILINQEQQKLTNSMGKARFKLDAKLDTEIRFEIRKDSPDRYYAPHFDTVKITKASKPTIKINAVLYSVPKPKPSQPRISQKLEAPEPENTPPTKVNPAENSKTIAENFSKKQSTSVANLEPKQVNPKQNDKKETELHAGENIQMEIQTEKKLKKSIAKIPDENTDDTSSKKDSSNKTISLSALPLKKDTIESDRYSNKKNQKEQNPQTNLLSLYVYSNSKPIANASIYIGYQGDGALNLICKTDQRGWCTYQVPPKSQKLATFVARKKGYQTVQKKIIPSPGDRLNFVMPKGETIDIFAIMKRYGHSRGLGNIEVYINDKYVGKTDEFGRLSHIHQGPAGDLVEVTLKTDEYLPKQHTTDYVVSGPLSLVRYYSPIEPEPILLALTPVQAAGKLKEETLSRFADGTTAVLQKSMDQYLFSRPALQRAPKGILEEISNSSNDSLLNIVKSGWINLPSKARLDGVIIPTLVLKKPLRIELALVDSSGRTLTAAQEKLSNLEDHNAISYAVKMLAKKLTDRFPFEGSIVQKENKNVWINIGSERGLGINAGDELDIHGPQKDRFGRSVSHNRIGKLRITEVKRKKSRGVITETAPRSSIDIGDQVILRSQNSVDDQTVDIQVKDKKNGKKVVQANIYFANKWLGSTDKNGSLTVGVNSLSKRGLLQIIKPGYQAFSKSTTLASTQALTISIERETSFIRIDSQPTGAKIFIDGKYIGTTPIEKPVAVPTGFVKLTASGEPSFKIYSNIIELGNGTLDLTGERAIRLEQDLLTSARKTLENGNIDSAIEAFKKIPENHSDYLVAQHQLGELYLGSMNKPALAAAAFAQVTQSAEIKGFNDKRFISAHINEGIALFKTGETLKQTEKQAAIAHYVKAFEVLQKVEPQLRYINETDQSLAVHNTFYYRALSAHRAWETSRDLSYLELAHKQWIKYLDGAAKTYPNKNLNTFIKTAEIYRKQVESSMKTAQSRVDQGGI